MKTTFRNLAMAVLAVALIPFAAIAASADRLFNESQRGGVFYNARVMFTTAWETFYSGVISPAVSYAVASMFPAMGIGNDIPGPAEFDRYRVTDANQSEVIGQPLFDWQLYPAAGQQEFTFFTNPVGQSLSTTPGAAAGTNKLLSDTNMRQGGSLPSGMEFLAESVEIIFLPGSVNTANTYTPVGVTTSATGALLAGAISANNDVQQVYNEGLVQMMVLNKTQFTETPLRRFPPCNWMETDAAMATTTAATNYAIGQTRCKGDLYMLKPKISLQATTNFNITITYPAVRALPSGFNGRIGVYLNGYLRRAAQ